MNTIKLIYISEVISNEPDSVVFEKYSKWQESRKYNEVTDRDTLVLKRTGSNINPTFSQQPT